MSTNHDLERRIADHYAAEAPPRAPRWVLDQILASVEATPQRRTVLDRPWTFPSLPIFAKLALTAMTIVTVGFVGLTLVRPGPVSPAARLGVFEPVAGRILSGVWATDPIAVDPRAPFRSTRLPMGPDPVLALGWSRDGTKLLFLRRDPTDQTFPYSSHLYLRRAEGTETQVTAQPVGNAAISPDGTRVAFAPDGDGLYLVDADGGQAVRITVEGSSPTFSPDGRQIAYLGLPADGCCVSPAREHVWVVNVDGTDAHEILADEPALAHGAFGLTWSPAGDRIALEDTLEGQLAIYTFAADGSDFRKVITGGMNPFWSPDGSRLAYLGAAGLTIADADGSHVQTLGDLASGPWHPGSPPDPAEQRPQGPVDASPSSP